MKPAIVLLLAIVASSSALCPLVDKTVDEGIAVLEKYLYYLDYLPGYVVDDIYKMLDALKYSWKDRQAAIDYFADYMEGESEENKRFAMETVMPLIDYIQWMHKRGQTVSPAITNGLYSYASLWISRDFHDMTTEEKKNVLKTHLENEHAFEEEFKQEFDDFHKEYQMKMDEFGVTKSIQRAIVILMKYISYNIFHDEL